MASSAADRSLADVSTLVSEAKRRLDADLRNIQSAVRSSPPEDDFPPSVFKAIATARRDALTSFGKVLRLPSDEPARQPALAWLSYTSVALTAMHEALRAERIAPATAVRKRRLARDGFARTSKAFLELDRELGCPFGCKGP
jgi:hypothetical protein